MDLRRLACWLLVGAAGCDGGKDDTSTTDSELDSERVEDSDPVVSTVVTVWVYESAADAPDANEAVLFFGPDGALVAEVETDAAGMASADLPEGGAVVYMLRSDDDALPYAPIAWLSVRAGDSLRYGGVAPVETTVQVTAPAHLGATDYFAAASCDLYASVLGGASPIKALSLPVCDHANVLVAARLNGVVQGVVAAAGVDTSAAVVLDGPYVAPAAFELTVAGIDADSESVAVDVWHALGTAKVPASGAEGLLPSAGRVQHNGSFAPYTDAEANIWVYQERSGYLRQTAERRVPFASDLSVDVAAISLPWITTPVFNPAERSVRWTTDGAGEVDGVLTLPVIERGGVTFTWLVSAVPDAAELVFPLLPAPWTDYNPTAGDQMGGDVLFVRGEGVESVFRQDPSSAQRKFLGFGTDHSEGPYGYALSRP